ncbi:hypothetical protein MTR_8g092530 [Medicago truncatula]|uniref:Uncharacterized protein n=1 Tax=Medicago truncatula TaxID=3880 RepID=G7LC85_MEDTR|nr:hypothetical protein MTR_8g092530 [Medicago truncatula]
MTMSRLRDGGKWCLIVAAGGVSRRSSGGHHGGGRWASGNITVVHGGSPARTYYLLDQG